MAALAPALPYGVGWAHASAASRTGSFKRMLGGNSVLALHQTALVLACRDMVESDVVR